LLDKNKFQFQILIFCGFPFLNILTGSLILLTLNISLALPMTLGSSKWYYSTDPADVLLPKSEMLSLFFVLFLIELWIPCLFVDGMRSGSSSIKSSGSSTRKLANLLDLPSFIEPNCTPFDRFLTTLKLDLKCKSGFNFLIILFFDLWSN